MVLDLNFSEVNLDQIAWGKNLPIYKSRTLELAA